MPNKRPRVYRQHPLPFPGDETSGALDSADQPRDVSPVGGVCIFLRENPVVHFFFPIPLCAIWVAGPHLPPTSVVWPCPSTLLREVAEGVGSLWRAAHSRPGRRRGRGKVAVRDGGGGGCGSARRRSLAASTDGGSRPRRPKGTGQTRAPVAAGRGGGGAGGSGSPRRRGGGGR